MNEASKPNPALAPLAFLIGDWTTTGTHPLVPDKTFHGKSSFTWIEGGAFLMMQSQIDEPEIPSGIAIFGSDDATGEFFLMYFDERGVSRKYDVQVGVNTLTWSRDTPEFAQRCTITLSADGSTMQSVGEMSKNGGAWEADLALTFRR